MSRLGRSIISADDATNPVAALGATIVSVGQGGTGLDLSSASGIVMFSGGAVTGIISDVDITGATDARAALVAALAAGDVWITPGTYLISSAITVPSNRFIYLMPGATLKAANVAWGSTGIFDLDGVSNVIIQGGTLDGDKANNATGAIFGVFIHNAASRITVRDVRAINMPGSTAAGGLSGDGFYVGSTSAVNYPTYVTLDNVTADGNVRQGLSITGGKHIKVFGGRFLNTTGTNPGKGIDVEQNGGVPLEDVLILGATVNGNLGGGITVAEGALTTRGLIAGCTVRDTGGVIASVSSITVRAPGWNVRDNDVEVPTASTAGTGIYIISASGGPTVDRVVIAGNEVDGNSYTANGRGIVVEEAGGVNLTDIEITGNTVFNVASQAIRVITGSATGAIKGLTIEQNILTDNNTAAAADRVLFLRNLSTGTMSDVSVRHNTIRDTRSGGNEADTGIETSGITAGELATWDVYDNRIDGPATAYVTARTRNRGANANTTDGATVTHGLIAAPTVVRVTPSVAGEMASVTATSSTTFTVALKTHAGAAGTSQTVYWEASV